MGVFMEQTNNSDNVMKRVSQFIVDKRKAFYLIFIIALIFCVKSIDKVKINNDITTYLPPTTETRIGLNIMEDEFLTYGSAQIMISNITYEKANELSTAFEKIDYVLQVVFDNSPEHYKESSAMISIMFEGEADNPKVQNAMEEVKKLIDGYDVYIISEVGADTAAVLQSEMQVILLIAAVVIVAVLLYTSKSYLEILVFIIVFAVAALLNMGTNFIFGEISFVTNSIAVVLQLALAIDYAIILCHRYMEERAKYPAREAVIESLSKAIIEISSSSLTTISGLIALMLMQLRIGFDMGIVLCKGILCSLLTVFLLMPGLLMLFNKGIEKTRHKNFVPKITFLGKAVVKTRYILPPIFLVVLCVTFVFSNKCEYVFSVNSIDTNHPSISRVAQDKIADTFGSKNTIALLLPEIDYEKEKQVVNKILALDEVTDALALSNIEVEDTHYLTDRMTPRQFSELAGVDIELARLLYRAYGISSEEYGAIFQNVDDYSAPLIKVFWFLCEQREKGVVSLTDEQNEKIDDLYNQLKHAKLQLEGKNWSRLVFTADVPEESQQTYDLINNMKSIAQSYYDEDVVVVGNSTSAKDLSESFTMDNLKISILTLLFVMIILLFTFKSVSLPVMLVTTIQGCIFINFAFPYMLNTNIYFLGYLIVSAIQMGATIDYAIVITNRYQELKLNMNPLDAVVETLNQSFPTIFTSGTIMTVAGFLIAELSTDPTIGSIGLALGRGTLTSIIVVMTVLPQILYLGDKIIEKTAITLNKNKAKKISGDLIRVDGHVRGKVSGFLDGDFQGYIHGDINAMVESKNTGKELNNNEEN